MAQENILTSWHSYPSIFNVGHAAMSPLIGATVNIEEKIDGSQFSFGTFDGEVRLKSKSMIMPLEAPEGMFALAADSVKQRSHLLHNGWTYRGEYVMRCRHNALTYNRVPTGNIIIFDINTAEETYLTYEEKVTEATRIGLETVPLLERCAFNSAESLFKLLERESVLGGPTIEGVVIKPKDYDIFGKDKKVLIAKFVSEAYKETHKITWKSDNPTATDVLQRIVNALRTDARWEKGIQHLRDAGKLENSPRDIGPLIKEIQEDTLKECEEEIKQWLFKWAVETIRRGVIRGFSEWYKERIAREIFTAD